MAQHSALSLAYLAYGTGTAPNSPEFEGLWVVVNLVIIIIETYKQIICLVHRNDTLCYHYNCFLICILH